MRGIASRIVSFISWLGRRPKKFTIPIALFLVTIVSFCGYEGVRAYHYVQHDPEFCRACHLMEDAWDRWESSGHEDVECHACHAVSMVQTLHSFQAFLFGRLERVESHSVVQDEACKGCHESGNPKWRQVAATAGHRQHSEGVHVACMKCHSLTVHRFTAPGTICSACHTEKHITADRMSEMHCTACHDYLATEHELVPERKECLDCHEALAKEGLTWPADAPMQFTCDVCHDPHAEETLVSCCSCHPDVKGLHDVPAHDLCGCDGLYGCETCHQPHQWHVTERGDCLTCHPDTTEHEAGVKCVACHDFRGG